MTLRQLQTSPFKRRAIILAAIILFQALCCLFFIVDVIHDYGDLGTTQESLHTLLEAIAAASLIAGLAFLIPQLLTVTRHLLALDTAVRAARGEMVELMERFFERWQLTPSERDVALLILKGLDNDAIASLRGTAAGTVRAQTTRIYAKAGVDGRAQLFSVFMEELFADD